MSDFAVRLTRADDLLVLRFEFVNLALAPGQGTLVRVTAGAEVLMVVFLPPQHLADEVFSPNSVDFSRERLPTASSRESRLVFRLPSDLDSLPLTVDALLSWDRFEPVLVPRLGEEPLDDPELLGVAEPLGHETAIELPYRLFLSPGPHERWRHHVQPFASGDRVELWHTRLIPAPTATRLGLAVVWSPDHPHASPVDDPFPTSLTSGQRGEIVQLSSDLGLLEDSNFNGLDPEQLQRLEALRFQRSTRLDGDRLMLSALGGWLSAHSRFRFPALPVDLVSRMSGHEMGPFPDGNTVELFALRDWSHVVAMGRDQYVRTVQNGVLFPFGHRAQLVTVTERTFISNGVLAEAEAYLMQQPVLVVHEPERRYHGHGTPFVSVRIMVPATPTLDLADDGPFVPKVGGVPFAFPIGAVDRRGAMVEARVPMVWVPVDDLADLGPARDLYAAISTVGFGGQQVAFAPEASRADRRRAGPGDDPGSTTLRTSTIQFGDTSVANALEPVVQRAQVHLPVLTQLGIPATESTIVLDPAYAAAGLAGVQEGVFARIVGGLPVRLSAGQAGGLLQPGLNLSGLSTKHGAMSNVDAVVDGFGAAPTIEGLSGRLLGVIDLAQVIAVAGDVGQVPKIGVEPAEGGNTVRFTWEPAVKRETLPPPLEPDGDPSLSVTVSMFRPVAPSSSRDGTRTAATEVNGVLRDIALTFLDMLRIGFSEIRFHTRTGQPPEFDVRIRSMEFQGDLAFLNGITALLNAPPDRRATGGPVVTITPEGVSAGLALSVPDFGLGVLSLRNLALSSTVTLYFADRPTTVRFTLSDSQHPFLVAYSVFGGGGHFALTAATSGTVEVEAAIEFGAAVSVNLVLARGVAQVMVGVLYETKGGTVTLGGQVRIYGCLEILGIVSLSVDFNLSLKYQAPYAIGRASLTVMVRVLGYSKSVTLTAERKFTMELPSVRSVARAVSRQDWVDYCEAFG